MRAYANARSGRKIVPSQLGLVTRVGDEESPAIGSNLAASAAGTGPRDRSLLDSVIEDLAARVAAAVLAQLAAAQSTEAHEWLDSRGAAEYLGVHRDTLRKLAAERTIPSHQDGPRSKLFFKRSELDDWRRAGGRSARLAATVAEAA
jgi:excisionase family DNA binding protein